MPGTERPAGEQSIKCAILTGLKEIKLVERTITAPGTGEVQVAIKSVGICGSDAAYWGKGVAGGFVPLDFTEEGLCQGYCGQMGHECAGVVVRVGPDVTHLAVGDRVAIEPGVPCGQCSICKKGRYNLCPDMKFIGSAVNKVPGAMKELHNHAASYCYKLPDHVSNDEGAMFEPLCVALNAVTRAKVSMGDHVLVTGGGPIGLLVMLAAKAAGAATVTVTDMVQAKLDKAVECGADFTFKANVEDPVATMGAAVGGKFDKCFECCGVVSALNICVQACESGGAVMVVANYPASAPVMLQEAARREIDLLGSYRYCNLYPTALQLVASGKVQLKPLITRTFTLEEANAAFEFFATGEPIKCIIKPGAD
jgi:L-iditol 2-dehydrogenase